MASSIDRTIRGIAETIVGVVRVLGVVNMDSGTGSEAPTAWPSGIFTRGFGSIMHHLRLWKTDCDFVDMILRKMCQ